DTITPREVERFLVTVLNVVKKNVKELKSLSQENILRLNNTLNDVVNTLEVKNSEISLLVDKKVDKNTFESQIQELRGYVLALAEEIPEIQEIDEEGIIEKALERVEFPETEEITGEDIVDKINELSITPDKQIDASHIKNLPPTKYYGGGGGSTDLSNVDLIGFNMTSDTDATQGQLKWDLDHETIVIGLDGESVPINFDSDTFVNQTGSTIPAGTPIYASGTLGSSGKITAAPFLNDGSIDQMYYIGITWGETENGGSGVYISGSGKLRGIDTSAYVDGTVLYPSETVAGGYQTTVPTIGFIFPIAFIIHSHAENGVMAIRWTQQSLSMSKQISIVDSTGWADGSDIHLSDTTYWNADKANIKQLRFETDATDWDLWILQNDNGYATDDARITARKLIDGASGNISLDLDITYEDEDASKEVHLYFVDNDGSNTLDKVEILAVKAN
ncbi:MAG: hypothetical protein U9O94_08715, partial [Nanoarchaeota archaeon]|nr:hypothetical protein [Nanoarchaeota archaeon]